MTQATLDLADAFFAAIEAGDIAAVRDLYADDVVVWHNHDGREQTRDENVRVLGWVVRNVEGLRYDDVRRAVTEDGFVQRHVLRGRTAGGADLTVPACLVVTVVEGRVSRVEEYLDSRHLDDLVGHRERGTP